MDELDFRNYLQDAGCTGEETERLCRIAETGDVSRLRQTLRIVRCRHLEKIHEEERKLRCLDSLIRETAES